MGPVRSISFPKSLVIVLLMVFAFPVYGYALPISESSHFVAGEILVKFKPEVSEATVNSIAGKMGATNIGSVHGIGVRRLSIPKHARIPDIVQRYLQDPQVEYAEPNYVARALYDPNDPYYSLQWALPAIQAPDAWDIYASTGGVAIAVVDSGVDASHPDLTFSLLPGWNFDIDSPNYNTNITDDDYGHGTHVAGIAAATTDNATGVTSVSFDAQILPVKVLNLFGNGSYSAVASGIIWAANNGAKVINLSLGGTASSQTLQQRHVKMSSPWPRQIRMISVLCSPVTAHMSMWLLLASISSALFGTSFPVHHIQKKTALQWHVHMSVGSLLS